MRVIDLFQIFIPSWKFFETFGTQVRLMVRQRSQDQVWQPWRPALQAPVKRSVGNFFINASWNLYLKQQSIVEQFVAEQSASYSANSTYFQIVSGLAADAVGPTCFEFQFKIVATHQERLVEDVYMSGELKC